MMKNSFINFCTAFYNSTFTPIQYYKNQELVLQLPESEYFPPIMKNKMRSLLMAERTVAYLETKEFHYFGIVKSRVKDEYAIIGPVLSGTCSRNELKGIMIDAAIPYQKLEEVNDLFQLFPIAAFNQFLNMLVLVNYELNKEYIGIQQIIDIENTSLKKPVDSIQAETGYITKENQNYHNTYQLELRLLKLIEDGNPEGIKQFAENASMIKSGVIAENSLRNMKNIFIVSVTLATRSAIRGGLDIEIAYTLSDAYILQMERLSAIDSIYQLQFAMLLDFAKRVASVKIPKGLPSDIYECIQYISRNTNRGISVSDVARHVGKNRSYLSKKFKSVMGFDISTFIMRKKLEEAKSLLMFTEKSISEISYYLCFSSQSYFQNLFRKKYGTTPQKYRNQYSR